MQVSVRFELQSEQFRRRSGIQIRLVGRDDERDGLMVTEPAELIRVAPFWRACHHAATSRVGRGGCGS
jgi:hypothetical protein